MARRKIFHRSSQSCVQQTRPLSTRQAFRDLASGKILEFPSSLSSDSFDFDNVDEAQAHFDDPLKEQAPNKIEQYLNPERYGYVEKTIEQKPPTPPVPEPIPEPAPAE